MSNAKNLLPFETMHLNYINPKDIRPKLFKKVGTCFYLEVSAQLNNVLIANQLSLQ